MGVSAKSKRIKRTKKKNKSELEEGIAQRSVPETTGSATADSASGVTASSSEAHDGAESASSSGSAVSMGTESASSASVTDSELNRLLTPAQLAEVRARIKAKQKEANETPKLFFELDRLRKEAVPATLFTETKFKDEEELKKAFGEVAAHSQSGEPFLFPFDVQELLLRGLLGGRYVPRWCRLMRFKYISQVALVVVDGVSELEWNDYTECFPHLQCMTADLPAKLLPPEVQGVTLTEELFTIPFSLSEQKVLDHYNLTFNGVKGSESSSSSRSFTETQADNFMAAIDDLKKGANQNEDPALRQQVERNVAQLLADKIEDPIAKEQMRTDGVLTWVDARRLHSDVSTRTQLLLTEAEMAREKFPLPYTLDHRLASEYATTSQEGYLPVTDASPLFAVDCEMCLTERNILELTHVAVVDEKMNHLINTFVKPRAKIRNYLTVYSGVTETILKTVTTTVEDVQRRLKEILPKDAILVGHSLNGDLNALRLIHPYVMDTSVLYNLKGRPGAKSKLRDLAYILLGRKIQEFNKDKVGHDASEDAEATMQLALLKLRNSLGFGDLTAPSGRWPTTTDAFVKWYEGVAVKQQNGRRRLGCEDEEMNEEVKLIESTTEAKVDDDATSRIPLRDAFLKRSAAAKLNCFRDAFEQLRIQRQKSGAAVDHEDLLRILEKSSATRRAALTDKLIVKAAVDLIPDNYFVSLQLHRYRSQIDRSDERKKITLRKLDNRLKKIHDALAPKAMILVVFSGRKGKGENGSSASHHDLIVGEANGNFHYGLVFGGIKTK